MKKEKDILKWFNRELKDSEINSVNEDLDTNIYSKIEHYASQLRAPEIDAKQALRDFRERLSENESAAEKSLGFKAFLRIAAVVVVMLGASYFVFFNNEKSFNTSIAETEILALPDKSEVILNADSELAYNKKTWNDERKLDLHGEAFFKVSKGQKFTVYTSHGTVQVLGTQFNVKERNDYFEVQCYEGSVSVKYKDEEDILSPGNTFRVLKGQVQDVESFSTLSPSWLNAESSFDRMPLIYVINEIQRHYDVRITNSNVNMDMLFTGTFTHNNINKALQAVTIPLRLAYKIDGKKVTIYKYNGE